MIRRHLQTVSIAALAIGLTQVPAKAQTRPSGGSIASGSVTIGDRIVQTSDRAVINWTSFSLGQGQSLQIDQPSEQAVLLNRVTGPAASQIDGTIYAGGGVYLVNPNGVTIGPSGAILAKGGVVTGSPGGQWITGEAGPELNTLMPGGGVRVDPLGGRPAPFAAEAAPQRELHVHVNVDRRELTRAVLRGLPDLEAFAR